MYSVYKLVALEYFELGIKDKLQGYLANLINGIKVNFTVHLGLKKENLVFYIPFAKLLD